MMITCIDYYGREIKSKVRPILKNGHMVHRIELPPGYKRVNPVTTLPDVEPDEIVWCWIDPKTAKGPDLEGACGLNLEAAAGIAFLGDFSVYDFLRFPPLILRQDRGYFRLAADRPGIPILDRTGTMEPADGSLHDPHEPGWEYVGSWKTTRRPTPVLQVTLWRAWVGQRPTMHIEGKPPPPITGHADYVAELDLDLEAGIKHVGEAIKNEMTGAKTNPYVVSQMLARYWGIVSFRLEPGTPHPDDIKEG